MAELSTPHFPGRIPEPSGYYQGVDEPERVICRNVIVFERLSRRTLQQKHLSNRMHHRYVLMHVLETPGVVSIDGKSIQLAVGDTLLVAPHQFHHYVDLDSDKLRWVFITFELQQGAARLDGLTYRVFRSNRTIEDQWGALASVWVQQTGASREQVLPMLDHLLLYLLQHESASGVTFTTKNEWITKVETLIIESVKSGRTFQEIAERVGLSERHLRARFEQQMGLSMRDYRSNYQFHRAISLMRDSQRSLADVAELTGFNSQSVFTRFIRRMAGQSPRVLRKQLLSGV